MLIVFDDCVYDVRPRLCVVLWPECLRCRANKLLRVFDGAGMGLRCVSSMINVMHVTVETRMAVDAPIRIVPVMSSVPSSLAMIRDGAQRGGSQM